MGLIRCHARADRCLNQWSVGVFWIDCVFLFFSFSFPFLSFSTPWAIYNTIVQAIRLIYSVEVHYVPPETIMSIFNDRIELPLNFPLMLPLPQQLLRSILKITLKISQKFREKIEILLQVQRYRRHLLQHQLCKGLLARLQVDMKNFKALYSIRRTHHGSVFPPDSHQAAGSIPYSSTTFPTISIYKAFSCIFPLHRHLPFLSLPDDRLLDTTTITTIYATATTAHIGALDLQPRDKFQISQNRKLNLSAQEFRQA